MTEFGSDGAEPVECCLNTVIDFGRPNRVVGDLIATYPAITRHEWLVAKPIGYRLCGAVNVVLDEIELNAALQVCGHCALMLSLT